MSFESTIIDYIQGIFSNPTSGTATALLSYFIIFRALPWGWDKYSKSRKKQRDDEEKARTETRTDVKEIKLQLIKLNGHTKDTTIHMQREEIFDEFVSKSTCKEKHDPIIRELGAIQKQNTMIIGLLRNNK